MAVRLLALIMMGTGLLAVGVGSPPNAGATDDITVTWPTVTAFNPDVYDYVVGIEYDGSGTVKLQDNWGSRVDLPSSGSFEVPFSTLDGEHLLRIYVCLDDNTCTKVARSPSLQVYRHVRPAYGNGDLGPTTAPFGGVEPGVPVDLEWKVLTPSPEYDVLLTGSATDHTGALPPIGENDVLDDYKGYEYVVTLSLEGPEWGTMRDTTGLAFTWDASPPSGAYFGVGPVDPRSDNASVPDDTFYPVRDKFRDTILMRAGTGAGEHVQEVSAEIRDSAGTVVFSRPPEEATSGSWWRTWNGRDLDGNLVPEGSYGVTLTAFDYAGNGFGWEGTINVLHDRAEERVWRRTFTARGTVLAKDVGRCASLKQPARSTWPGSLGYYSAPRCSRRSEWSVATTNGAYVKRSPIDEYQGIRVTVNGGKAPGEDSSYLVLSYLDRDGDWVSRKQLSAALGKHPGTWLGGRRGIHVDEDEDERPYVVWSAGNGGGAKYDVKSFTVEVRYVDLR